MKHTSVITSIIFSFLSAATSAQELQPLQADRPDQTESTATVPAKFFQVEAGFGYEQVNTNEKNLLHPTILWKYGLSARTELRLITELGTTHAFDEKYAGISPVTVGFKTKIAEEQGWVPAVSFIGHLSLPMVASGKNKATYYAPAFRFTLQHTLSPRFSLGYNLGAEWDGESPETIFIYTLTTGYAVTGKLGVYMELYGFAPEKSKADHRADGGFTFLLRPNVMLDISGGVGLSPQSPDYYAALGFSFRLPR